MHILFLAPILPALWLAYKAFKSPYPWPVRLFLMLLPIGVSQIYNIQRSLFGSLSGPNVSATILEVQIWAFATMILFFFGLLLVDFGRLCLRIKRFLADKKKAGKESGKITTTDPRLPSRRSFLVKSTALGMSVAVPAGLVSRTGVANAVATPIINAWNVYLPDLPEELEGTRLVQFADLHLGPLSSRKNLATLIENINDLKPDLVCLCGDLADGSPAWRSADNTPRGRLAELFGRLSATHGVYACTGNHEYYSDYKRWMRIWKEQGIRFLHNTAISLPWKNANLVLGGLARPLLGPHRRAHRSLPHRAGQQVDAQLIRHRKALGGHQGQALRLFRAQILGGVTGEAAAKGHKAVDCEGVHFHRGGVSGHGGGAETVDHLLDEEIPDGKGALL